MASTPLMTADLKVGQTVTFRVLTRVYRSYVVSYVGTLTLSVTPQRGGIENSVTFADIVPGTLVLERPAPATPTPGGSSAATT